MDNKNNFLAMRPVILPNVAVVPIDGRCTLTVYRSSFLHRLFAKWFHKVFKSVTSLDDYGTFVVQHCDGNLTVGEIAGRMRQQFGVGIEPVDDRLIEFLRTLADNHLLQFQNP